MSLRWLLQKDIVPSVIIGAKNLKQLEDNIGAAADWELTTEQVQIDKILYSFVFCYIFLILVAKFNQVLEIWGQS